LNNTLTDPLSTSSNMINRTVIEEEDRLSEIDLCTDGKFFFEDN